MVVGKRNALRNAMSNTKMNQAKLEEGISRSYFVKERRKNQRRKKRYSFVRKPYSVVISFGV